MTDNANTKMRKIGYRPPENVAEPDKLVLVEYVSGGRIAIITLNRSQSGCRQRDHNGTGGPTERDHRDDLSPSFCARRHPDWGR